METSEIAKQFIPKKWRKYFEIESLTEKKNEWNLILREKTWLIPAELRDKRVVLNGYLPRVEIIDFPFQGKLMYIRFIRRRWKEEGKNESYYNTYTFHRKGMKTTDEFGDFLKGLDREEFDEFCNAWPSVLNYWEEDL